MSVTGPEGKVRWVMVVCRGVVSAMLYHIAPLSALWYDQVSFTEVMHAVAMYLLHTVGCGPPPHPRPPSIQLATYSEVSLEDMGPSHLQLPSSLAIPW